jgi:hypothetical protein
MPRRSRDVNRLSWALPRGRNGIAAKPFGGRATADRRSGITGNGLRQQTQRAPEESVPQRDCGPRWFEDGQRPSGIEAQNESRPARSSDPAVNRSVCHHDRISSSRCAPGPPLVRALPKPEHAHKERSGSQYRDEDVSPGRLRSVETSDDARKGPRPSTRLALLYPCEVSSQPLPIQEHRGSKKDEEDVEEEIHRPSVSDEGQGVMTPSISISAAIELQAASAPQGLGGEVGCWIS